METKSDNEQIFLDSSGVSKLWEKVMEVIGDIGELLDQINGETI